ncbi:MAG: sporulation protein [Sphaerobacteraceae bacterium]|nr:MAG: sporulation protein [Sphaerobacteraceae bacterium]
MVNIEEILSRATDSMTVNRVFGEPIERDGATVIPVAKVSGGGGGGGGKAKDEERDGSGGGFGVNAEPVGAYLISDGKLSWHPATKAVDVTRIVISSNLVAIALLLVLRSIFVSRKRGN